MRLFVATDLPPAVLDAITEVQSQLRKIGDSTRWVQPTSMHLTLKFLGEVTESRLPAIDERLRTLRTEPFQVHYSGVGFFPNARAPRVLWIGVGSRALEDLAHEMEVRMVELGFPAEKRPFNPHLTVARSRRDRRINRSVVEAAARYDGREFGTYSTDRFYLFQSTLRPDGAEYKKLFEYPLLGPDSVL